MILRAKINLLKSFFALITSIERGEIVHQYAPDQIQTVSRLFAHYISTVMYRIVNNSSDDTACRFRKFTLLHR